MPAVKSRAGYNSFFRLLVCMSAFSVLSCNSSNSGRFLMAILMVSFSSTLFGSKSGLSVGMTAASEIISVSAKFMIFLSSSSLSLTAFSAEIIASTLDATPASASMISIGARVPVSTCILFFFNKSSARSLDLFATFKSSIAFTRFQYAT